MTNPTQTQIHQTALNLHQNGCSIVPVTLDGSKRPAIPWKTYTQTHPTTDLINNWFNSGRNFGIGVITGKISGNLEMLEIEGRATSHVHKITELAKTLGLEQLWHRVNTGWLEKSPTGGIHWFIRLTTTPPGNTKLAMNENGETLAETRGEGGFVVLAPTPGTGHTTGQPWTHIIGGPQNTPTLTPEEHQQLHHLITAALHTNPTPIHKPQTQESRTPAIPTDSIWATSRPGDTTPGDDYEAKTSWDQILTPHGWTRLHTDPAGTTYWRRPGKNYGISATTGNANDRDRLYVFTSSTSFTPETPYTKFAAYTHLNHHDDYTQAAKQLAADGYGHKTITIPKQTIIGHDTLNSENLTPENIINPPRQETIQAPHNLTEPTETNNANLLALTTHNALTYQPDTGKWAAWTGTRWEISPDDAPAIQATITMIENLPANTEAERKHKTRSKTAKTILNTIRLARANPHLRTNSTKFDQNPYLLNTPGGEINLHTGKLQPANPKNMCSKQTTVTPDPTQTPTMWLKFLDTTFAGNQELITYVQQLIGVSLLGEVQQHILPFLHGQGANGKSTFLETIAHILGDYAGEAPPGLLIKGPAKHETELAYLQGKRFVITSEVNEGARLDEAKVKALTGGDQITARHMRQDFYTFTPTHTLWQAANNQPKIEAGGESIWRRIRLIPFTQVIPEKDRIEGLTQKLVKEEAPGILAWCIAGCVDYLKNGLHTPDVVMAATHEYRHEEDHLARFIEERCILTPHGRTPTADIRAAYDQWCAEENEHPLNTTAFGRQLRQRYNIEMTRSHGRKQYIGLMLAEREEDTTTSPWR